MCGFYLAHSLEGSLKETDKNHVSLKHRGPDSEGVFKDAHFFAHFYRLRILGGESGTQPMVSPSQRYVMVFNGEIYNYKELAETVLGRPKLSDLGDSRVLLELLEAKGLDAVQDLNGMFAIALYDQKERSLHLIRDRFGVKPINVFVHGGTVFASSEIKAFFKQMKPELDREAVEDYLDYGVYPSSDKTFYHGVRQVTPGTILSVTRKGISEKRYFNVVEEIKKWEERRPTTQEFEYLLADSIRLRLRSDIPINLHYSGGTDSTAILIKTKEVWGWDYPLETFTFAYADDPFDESKYSAKYCQELGIQNHQVVLRPEEVPALARENQFFQDELYGGIPVLAYLKCNRIQRDRGFTVALEGQGGDEALGGYPSHLLLAAYDLAQTGENPDLLALLLSRMEKSKAEIVAQAEKFIDAGFAAHSDLTDLRPGRGLRNKTNQLWLHQIQLYDLLQNKLPRVLRFEDRASMATSREIRFPLLDFRVMSCGISLRTSQKFEGGYSKAPLLQIVQKYLKQSFLTEKRSVVSPQTPWLQGPLRRWVEENITALSTRGVVKEEYIQKGKTLLDKPHLENSFYIWQLVNLNLMLSSWESSREEYSHKY